VQVERRVQELEEENRVLKDRLGKAWQDICDLDGLLRGMFKADGQLKRKAIQKAYSTLLSRKEQG
jgi:hypothetical protein